MASSRATGFDVITTGAGGIVAAGWINNGCVFVMFIADAAVGAAVTLSSRVGGSGRIAAPVSSLVWTPGGFGNGCKSGDVAGEEGGVTGGRRGRTLGASGVDPEEGSDVICGGNRRIGVTGVRDGRTILAVSRLATLGSEAACSGGGGSAIRTVSFFGSAMGEQRAIKKIAQTGVGCHLLI
jgi:hypothetical protein